MCTFAFMLNVLMYHHEQEQESSITWRQSLHDNNDKEKLYLKTYFNHRASFEAKLEQERMSADVDFFVVVVVF